MSEKDKNIIEIGSGSSKIQFTKEELDSFLCEKNNNVTEIEKETNDIHVGVCYNASMDMYIVKNKDTGEQKILDYRSGLENQSIDEEKLLEEFNRESTSLINLDMNIYKVLLKFDNMNGSNKANEYFEIVTDLKRTRKQILKDMEKKSKIDIEYYLPGLYNGRIPLEDRINILNTANNAYNKGIAWTTKGIVVAVMEKIDRWKIRKQKVGLLTEGNKQEVIQEEKNKDFRKEIIISEKDKQKNNEEITKIINQKNEKVMYEENKIEQENSL